MIFGLKIKQLRSEKKISQRQLANELEISANDLSRIETGKQKTFTLELLIKISDYFNVTLDWLIADVGTKYRNQESYTPSDIWHRLQDFAKNVEESDIVYEMERVTNQIKEFKNYLDDSGVDDSSEDLDNS